MDDDEMKYLIENLFAKADTPEVPPYDDPNRPDPISVSYVYAAHAFIKEAIFFGQKSFEIQYASRLW